MPRKPKVVFKMGYKGDGTPIDPPLLRNLSKDFLVESATLKEIGRYENDKEYMLIKVICKPTEITGQ